jgi:hypothetical protein
MVTTTPAEIVAHIVTLIEGLSPTRVPKDNVGFRENPAPNGPLKTWPIRASSTQVLRLFDVAQDGDRVDLHLMDPQATLCEIPFLVMVAYPSVPGLLGMERHRDIEALMSTDAQQIRNAIFATSGLAAPGHQGFTELRPRKPDRSNAAIWFQEIAIKARLYVAQ